MNEFQSAANPRTDVCRRDSTRRSAAAFRERRGGYPSDVSDAQWETLARLLPFEESAGRRRTDLREVVNGINYRWRTGCVWRMLPHDLPPWETVYFYFNDWRRAGVLPEIRNVLLRRKGGARGRGEALR